MKKGIRDSLHCLYDSPTVTHRYVVAMHKNEIELSEAKKVRHKVAEVETGKGNSVLAALTKQVAYLMATSGTKNSSPGNEGNEDGHQNKRNIPGNQQQDNTTEMKHIKIIVVVVINIKHQGTRELKVKFSDSDARDGDI